MDSQQVFSFYFSPFAMSNGLIFGVLARPAANCRLLRAYFRLDFHCRNCRRQVTHAHQIVGRRKRG
jgi:hypothetical protein